MGSQRWTRGTIALAAMASALTIAQSGCTGSMLLPRVTSGSARVAIAAQALSSTVASVQVTISAGGGPAFATMVAELTQSNGTWAAYITGIPVGPGREFDIAAYDSSGNKLYAGSGAADITAGAVAAVVITVGAVGTTYSTSAPVIQYVSASATLVAPGGTVQLSASATDADPTATLSYQWVAVCGSFDNSTNPSATWTAPTTPQNCQISVTVTNNSGSAVTAYLVIDVGVATGAVLITVNGSPAVAPVITGMTAKVSYGTTEAGDLTVTASDPAGYTLSYVWTSNCANLAFNTSSPYSVTAPHFTNIDLTKACVVTVTVTDTQNGTVTGVLSVPPAPVFQAGPIITLTTQPSIDPSDQEEVVNPGDAVVLGVQATDPQNNNLKFSWSTTAGTITGQVDSTKAPWQSVVVYNVPTPLASTMQVKATVTDTVNNESATHVFTFKGGTVVNPCAGQPDGTACNDGNPCTTGDACKSGTCTGTAVSCPTPDQCHSAGTCNPTTGTCSNPALADGTPCNDGNACTTADVCGSGVCVGAPVTCTAADQCHTAGTCAPSTGQCSNPTAADGTACNDNNACTQTDTCQAGVCTGSNPVVCTSGGTCNPSTGLCTGGSATPAALTGVLTPSTLTAGANQAFTATLAVTDTGETTANGVQPLAISACTGGTPGPINIPAGSTAKFQFTFCSSPTAGPLLLTTSATGVDAITSASVSTGNVAATVTVTAAAATQVVPEAAKDLPIEGPVGLAMDVSGNTYVAGAIYPSSVPYSFDGHMVQSGGDADIFVAKYNTAGVAQWAVGYGDGAAANPQIGTGAAVTNDGTLAVIGTFTGTFSIGSGALSSASAIDFLAFLHQADGTGITALQFNDGSNGALKSVAANPNDSSSAHGNRIAVCGVADGGTPTAFVGTSAIAATAEDIIIGVFTSSGTKLWASQFSSAGNFSEECDSVAVDDNGDVWAMGFTTGASLNFGGSTSTLTGPGVSTRKFVWIAKFNGATGAAEASAIFGGSTGQANPNPAGGVGLGVDSAGNVVAAGQFIGAITFGGTTLTTAGGRDAWVAKLGPTLAPIWAERLGGPSTDDANGVAVDSEGDVLVTGAFTGTATIGGTTASPSTITSGGASDVFVWKLNGATGATDFVAGYGDPAVQTGDAIVANRFGPDQVAFAGTLNGTITFPPLTDTLSVTSDAGTDVFLVAAGVK